MASERVDILLVGSSGLASWPLGETAGPVTTPAELTAALGAWLARPGAGALLLWDPRLGAPVPAVVAQLAAGRNDVSHAGLSLGCGGWPGLLDFVSPNWMFNCDGPEDRETTSWRASPAACIVRRDVLAQIGLPCDDFVTVQGAWLEWGMRAVTRGPILRHVPALIAGADAASRARVAAERPPLADEMRLIAYRCGRRWARWAVLRAGSTGYAPASELMAALRAVPVRRPYDEPPPYRTPRSLGTPDLARARVTVLIPTLDRYPYLHVVLENLRAQTVRPHEIVVVDQTAADQRDPTIATKFADLPLVLLYRDQPGQCSSRNEGLRASSGDFILFVDDDDELPPDLIERHLANLAKYAADVASGSIREVGTAASADAARVRASDLFPTGNSLVRREVLVRSGLFDLAFDRAPRADGELGMRVYQSGALMVIDESVCAIHHRAPQGGLREHRARGVTYQMSREMLRHRHLPHISEIYLTARHFTPRQLRESLWLRAIGTLSGRGTAARRLAKALIGGVQLPDTLYEIVARKKRSEEWLQRFPQIGVLES